MYSYDSSLLQVKGIGEKSFKLYQKLGLTTVGDLLHYYPKGYERFEAPKQIASLNAGETAAVLGRVLKTPLMRKTQRLSVTTLEVRDETGLLSLIFFNMPFLSKILKPGMVYVFRGIVQTKGPSFVMEQPRMYSPADYEKLSGLLMPKYALTKGLTNQSIQKAVKTIWQDLSLEEEYLPDDLMQRAEIPELEPALREIHFPQEESDAILARRRFVFDEFFSFLLQLRRNKDAATGLPNEYVMIETADTVRYIESLPYRLTKGQKQVWQEIREDLEGPLCMNRLIQGDVGSGKTILAFLALLMTVANGYQGALMAPTEVLAVQHYENVCKDVKNYHLAFRPVLLVGSMTAKEKRDAYERIASGDANLIIGTHTLIQEKVKYQKLALVVTDEQHRFGVHQRETLAEKGLKPHVLVMSATPIPRTLAIILYGDLQISVIKEKPEGRLPIKNCVVGTTFRPKAYKFIADQVAQGHQAYVICPQVEEGEMEDLEDVVTYAEKLRSALPAGIVVAHLHGRMRPADKNRIMQDFAAKNIDVLVSTTVIEVGINVPNATVMMVENAERFGLAQLHQLRGRVGRGEAQSYCIFLSTNESKEVMDRLQILNTSNDGFYVASEDLKLRGPGDLFGVRQSGDFAFRIGDVYNDAELLKTTSEIVDDLIGKDPDLSDPEHRKLREHFARESANSVDFRTI
ncbi:MAG: ATP-dependent DNA helicase RecG [Lachnospiraceae bacterium]|nr:ATP-dependent DNA helicase RecG [Lachnospiraceae bacterium]MBQ3905896.1 ATP-dependent DNA helicase RecG [Lachnospiraceae bacterium]